MSKAAFVVTEVLDERGRFVSPEEFRWLMRSFRDRYDPRRLTLALMFCAGLRLYDAVRARLKWFSNDFTSMKMSQCKPRISKKDGVIRAKLKPRFVPLPEWLSKDLRNYITFRVMVGVYVGESLDNYRLFPKLGRKNLYNFFAKMRLRHSEECPWLLDLWQVIKSYDENRNLIRVQKRYRVAPHAGRAHYCTAAYEVSRKDVKATQVLTGHSKIKDLDKYLKVSGIMEKKLELCNNYVTPLQQIQKTPILTGQKTLHSF